MKIINEDYTAVHFFAICKTTWRRNQIHVLVDVNDVNSFFSPRCIRCCHRDCLQLRIFYILNT